MPTPDELQQEYALRFKSNQEYRDRVWKILTADFFQRFVPLDAAVLDLGCGWGEFINNIRAAKKYGMDLNPDSAKRVLAPATVFQQSCSDPWPLPAASLDVVFTSNFFEHLPTKDALRETLAQAHRCLRPGGLLICLGPNIRCVPGAYWDFWDHHIALSDKSLEEVLRMQGFRIRLSQAKFLPYTMAGKKPAPLFLIRWYLKLPLLWRILGKQFLVIGRKE